MVSFRFETNFFARYKLTIYFPFMYVIKNVLYPTADLTTALLDLLQNLKPSDWHKSTELNGCTVSALVVNLINAHNPKSKCIEYTLPNRNLDTVKNIELLIKDVQTLKTALSKTTILSRSKNATPKYYCYCWLLQQYIRQALNNNFLLTHKFYFPLLNHLMVELPYHYLNIDAEAGFRIKIKIVGDAGGVWVMEKAHSGWQFVGIDEYTCNTTVYLDQQIAWLLFSGSVHFNEIGQYYQVIGSLALGYHFFSFRANCFAAMS